MITTGTNIPIFVLLDKERTVAVVKAKKLIDRKLNSIITYCLEQESDQKKPVMDTLYTYICTR